MPPPSGGVAAEQAVQAPGIALMIFGGVNALQALLFVVVGIVGSFDPSIFENSSYGGGADVDPMMNVVIAIIMGIIMLGASGLIFFGGMKMRQLESFGIAMAAAIAAVIPCTTIYCCIPGIALGIWALVVLNKPEVKSSFR